jgi:molecular chaperone GrpE
MTSRPERDLSVPSVDGEIEPGGESAEPVAGRDDAVETIGEEGRSQLDAAAEEILTDVAALTAERDEYLAALQRAQADFANYRKRVMRQQEEQGNRAVLDLVAKILPVLDTLDLAMTHLAKEPDQGDDGPPGEASGEGQALFRARTQLLDTLAKEGLERIDEVGVGFDPAVHDAVAHAASEAEDTTSGPVIDEVMRSGYRWHGRTLRPAMVRVRG